MKLLKAVVLNEQAKVYITNTTNVVTKAIEKHDLWPSAASCLGKTMTIGLLMGGTLKQDQALTIKIDANGPIGQIVVDANGHGNVRGYVTNPHVNFTKGQKLDEITTLGHNGFIDVIKDLHMNDLFTSSIEVMTGDLAKDFTYYLTKSEQVFSALLLGSKFDVDNTCMCCGGMLIQLLPNASEETIAYLENMLNKPIEFSDLLLKNDNLEDILKIFFNDQYQILEEMPVQFKCHCSYDHFKIGLGNLGKKEIQEMIDDGKDIEVVCHYCNSKYTYSIDNLKDLLKYAK